MQNPYLLAPQGNFSSYWGDARKNMPVAYFCRIARKLSGECKRYRAGTADSNEGKKYPCGANREKVTRRRQK